MLQIRNTEKGSLKKISAMYWQSWADYRRQKDPHCPPHWAATRRLNRRPEQHRRRHRRQCGSLAVASVPVVVSGAVAAGCRRWPPLVGPSWGGLAVAA